MMRATVVVTILLSALVVLGNSAVAATSTAGLGRPEGETEQTPGAREERPELRRVESLVPRSLEEPVDPLTYVLGPSDELVLVIRGPETKSYTLRVLPEGFVILPNVGAIRAAGLVLEDFRGQVRDTLERYYPGVGIDCRLLRTRAFVVFVLGEVESAGPIELTVPFRLSAAVSKAGGVKERGSRRRIEIREGGDRVRTADLFAFVRLGAFDENPTLREGYSVYVPPKEHEVTVIGEVKLPGTYELVPGETAADILALCGGFTSQAYRERLVLERLDGATVSAPAEFSADEAATIELRDRDVIVVRERMGFEGKDPVLVIGGGGRSGTVPIGEPEPLRTFLPRLWRIAPGFDASSGVLEQRSPGGTPTDVPFDARQVLAGDPVGETLVKPGDTISFPPFERDIFVAGEVRQPGGVPYQPGATVEYYISRVGGPNQDGSFDRLSIYSVGGNERGGDRNSVVYRGETIVVKRKKSKVFGSIFVGVTSLTSLVLSIVAIASK